MISAIAEGVPAVNARARFAVGQGSPPARTVTYSASAVVPFERVKPLLSERPTRSSRRRRVTLFDKPLFDDQELLTYANRHAPPASWFESDDDPTAPAR